MVLASFRRGLADVGYAEGRSVPIEYRFADGRRDLLSAQLTDLTQRKAGVIRFHLSSSSEELVQPSLRYPSTGIPRCCARAASGQAAAPPSAPMNSRRRRQILI